MPMDAKVSTGGPELSKLCLMNLLNLLNLILSVPFSYLYLYFNENFSKFSLYFNIFNSLFYYFI